MATSNPQLASLAAQLNNDPNWIAIVTNNRVGQDTRQAMMQAYAASRGIQLPQGYHFDAGGSASFVPDRHPGRAGLTVGSLLLGGGALAGGLLGAGASGAAQATAGPTILTGAGSLPAASLPTIAGPAGAAHTVGSLLGFGGGGFSIGDIVKSALGPSINAVTGLIAAHGQNKLAGDTLAAQTAAEKYAADLQAKSATDQLAFLKEQEATRRSEFDKTTALNLDQYNQGLARLAPYRRMGENALAAFGRPIGNIGSLLGV